MAIVSKDLVDLLRAMALRYGIHEKARRLRADEAALTSRSRTQDETFYLLAKARHPVALGTLLDGLSEPRPLATVHVRQMVDAGRLKTSGSIDGNHDEDDILIGLT